MPGLVLRLRVAVTLLVDVAELILETWSESRQIYAFDRRDGDVHAATKVVRVRYRPRKIHWYNRPIHEPSKFSCDPSLADFVLRRAGKIDLDTTIVGVVYCHKG